MINKPKQSCVLVERRPVVQEALYKWYAIVCSSGDVFHLGLLKVLVVCFLQTSDEWLPLYVVRTLVGVFFIVIVAKAVGLMGADHQIQNDHGTSCRPTSNITSNTGPCLG